MRLVLAQPQWLTGGDIRSPRFERSAWLILATPEAAKEALALLHNLRVKVLGSVDITSGVAPVVYTFTPLIEIHNPQERVGVLLPENISTLPRINLDIQRATELSAKLDKERAVPEEQSLASLLQLCEGSELVEAMVSYKLDLILAYLRRVHLVSYYTARRFRDEAHLLSMAPEVTYRQSPFIPPVVRVLALLCSFRFNANYPFHLHSMLPGTRRIFRSSFEPTLIGNCVFTLYSIRSLYSLTLGRLMDELLQSNVDFSADERDAQIIAAHTEEVAKFCLFTCKGN